MTLVVDNSVALAWTLIDERSDRSETVLEKVKLEGGHVPFIFRAEYANALVVAARRGRMDSSSRIEALAFIETLQLTHDVPEAARVAAASAMADVYQLTVYDALYLELAQRLRLPLATFDRKLADSARSAGIALAVE